MSKQFWLNHWLHLILLSTIVWLVFSRTLGSYFLADDFGEILYVSRICNGEYNLLWLNFTGNFMSVPGMSVWRPWLLVSLLIDFLIWKANPIGFYLTNLLSYNAAVILLYWLMRLLTNSATKARSCLTAFLTAALFAVSPLHCESVSWVVGRVDVVCAVFYLLCLCLFLKADSASTATNNKQYKLLVAGYLTCFWISIWTKEMTIGAPILAPALLVFFGSKPLNIKHTCKISAPLWLSTVLYFALRYMALGTLLGGYTQGIGDSQAANALSRWLDFDTLHRLFLPFANSIYGQQPSLAPWLTTCYLVILTVLLVKALSLRLNLKWLAILLLWIITCLAPLYKLWGLGYELEGARFCFFLTLPLSALVPALLLIDNKSRSSTKWTATERCLTTVGLVATILAGTILAKTAIRTNLSWVHAGKEVREFLNQTADLNKHLLKQKQETVLLGIPKRHGGAHMILNGAIFRKALSPPFTDTDLTSQIYTFDPVFFSENFKLDVSRFRRIVSGNKLIAFWDDSERRLKQLTLLPVQQTLPKLALTSISSTRNSAFVHTIGRATIIPSDSHSTITLTEVQEGDGISFPGLDLNPLSADILQAEITLLKYAKDQTDFSFSANFNEYEKDLRCQVKIDKKIEAGRNKPFLINIPLSQNWRWFASKKVDTISLLLPGGTTVKVDKARLLKSEELQPVLTAPNYEQSKDGQYLIPSNCDSIDLDVRLPKLEQIEQASVYITGKNAFFDTFKNQHEAVEQTLKVPIEQSQQLLTIDAKSIKSDAYRQISVQLLEHNNNCVGLESDPIMIKFKN